MSKHPVRFSFEYQDVEAHNTILNNYKEDKPIILVVTREGVNRARVSVKLKKLFKWSNGYYTAVGDYFYNH